VRTLDAPSALLTSDMSQPLIVLTRPVLTLFACPSRRSQSLSHQLLAAKSGGRSLFAAVSSLIQDQRSHNMQVLLSLQDPTLMPSDIFARSAVTIIHRLWSPVWLEHLGRNIGLPDRDLDGVRFHPSYRGIASHSYLTSVP
jgi:hypothetical protein